MQFGFRRARNGELDSERGSLAVEFAVVGPLLILIVAFLIAGARLTVAGNAVESAAASAAREASLSRSGFEAQMNATETAQLTLSQSGYTCSSLSISINDSGLGAQLGETGVVSATLNCTVNMSDIALPGLSGTRTLTATASSPVDAYRERND